MKKLFTLLVVAFAMLATSCSKDADVITPGEEVLVSFDINTPELATRAISDGTTATKLYYAVYDGAGNYLPQLSGEEPNFNISTTLKFKLVDGMTYKFAFWAQNPAAPYTFTPAEAKVTVNYTTGMLANQEIYDAFFAAIKGITIKGGMQKSVELFRPFAQLNVVSVAEDIAAAAESGITVTQTEVKVKAYKTLDLMEGTVSDQEERTFGLNAILTDKFGTEDTWLGMNYILVDDDQELVDVIFTTDNDKVSEKKWVNIPVQRNYRTNIIGYVLTNDVDVNVEIKPDINDGESITVTEVATAQSLQEAINDPDTDMITLTDDINLNDLIASLTATRAGSTNTLYVVNGRELKLDLNGFELSGVDESTSSYALIDNKGKLTILNSNTEKEGKITLSATNNRNWNAYSSVISNNPGGELTIENGVVVEHLGGTDMAYAIDNLTNGRGTSAIATINGGVFKSSYRTVRMFLNGVEATNKMTINAGEFYSYRTSGQKASIWLQNASAKVNTGELYIGANVEMHNTIYLEVVSGGVDADVKVSIAEEAVGAEGILLESAYSKIAKVDGVYTLADAAVATIGETKYYSFDAAFEAAQSGDTIVLVDNAEATTDKSYVLEDGKTLNLELGGYTLYAENTRTATHNFLIDVKGGVLNVENGTIQYKHTGNNMEWNGACTVIDITAGGVVNMEDVTVENLGGTDMNFSVHLNNWGEVTLNADKCEFLSTYCGVRVNNSGYDMNNVTIKNSKLTGSTRAFWVHNYIGDLNPAQHSDEAIKARLNLDIYNNGNTFEVTGEPVSPIRYGFGETVYLNEAGKIVGFSGYDEVGDGLYKKETKYRVTNANGLALINSMMESNEAGKGITVELWDNIDFTGKTWTPVDSHVDTAFTIKEFNGNNYTISNLTIKGQAMFKRFANNSDVTFKNVTFDKATVDSNGSINTAIIVVQTYNNLLLENVDVKNSSITGGYKVATLVGTVYNESSSSITATLKDCDVTDTTVKATSYDFCTAGLVSFVYVDDNDNIEFENCTISDVKLYAPNVYSAHAAIYTTGSETLYNEAAGVTVTNVTFENI